MRALLRRYLEQRVLFYITRDAQQPRKINADTAKLQADLWSALRATAAAQPTPVVALALASMNDVLNSQDTRRLRGGTDPHPGVGSPQNLVSLAQSLPAQ